MVGDDVRQKVCIGLAEALAGDDEPSEEEGLALASLAEEIERAMFAQFEGTSRDYKSKYRTLLFNLKDEKNPTLRRRVRSRELSIAKLITLDAKALASEELQMARQELQERYFATRKQVDGEMLVGWQAGTNGSLNTHKNTDTNKLGSAVANAEETAGAADLSPLLDDPDDYSAGEGAARIVTPLAMEDDGTPLHVGDDEDGDAGGIARASDLLDDDDIWNDRDDDSAQDEPPPKARKLAAPVAPPPVLTLRDSEKLLPTDFALILADDARLQERIQRAYAVRDLYAVTRGSAA